MSETEPVPEYCLTIPIPMQKRNIKGILWSAAQLFPFKNIWGILYYNFVCAIFLCRLQSFDFACDNRLKTVKW